MVIPWTLEYQSPWEGAEKLELDLAASQSHLLHRYPRIVRLGGGRTMGRAFGFAVAAEVSNVNVTVIAEGGKEVSTRIMDIIWTLGGPTGVAAIAL